MTDDGKALAQHLETCATEYLFDGNGHGEWHVPRRPVDADAGGLYVVDQDVVPKDFAAVMVRQSDGARFGVDVSVTVWPLGVDEQIPVAGDPEGDTTP